MYSNIAAWDSEHFFIRLEAILAERGMSLHELSCRTNTSISTLYKMRSQKNVPNLHTVCTICDVLEIKLWEFFATEDEISPEMKSVISDMRRVSQEGQEMLTLMVKFIK